MVAKHLGPKPIVVVAGPRISLGPGALRVTMQPKPHSAFLLREMTRDPATIRTGSACLMCPRVLCSRVQVHH